MAGDASTWVTIADSARATMPSSFESKLGAPPEGRVLSRLLLESPNPRIAAATARASRMYGVPVELIARSETDLIRHQPLLRSGSCLPLGRPSFVREATRLACVQDARWDSHPRNLATFMPARPCTMRVEAALGLRIPHYVFPFPEQPFDAFLLGDDDVTTPYDRRHLLQAASIPWGTPLLLVPVRGLESRWTYYVVDGDVIGFGQVPPQAVPTGYLPDAQDVSAMIAALPRRKACILELGVLRSGETAFLRLQEPLQAQLPPTGEPWPALMRFLSMLWARWCEVREATIDGPVRLELSAEGLG